MKNDRVSQPIHAGVGSASVILIFLVLCLTAFGILSLVSARNSLGITKANIDYVCSYYNAFSLANTEIADNLAHSNTGEFSEVFPVFSGVSLITSYTIDENGRVSITEFYTDSDTELLEF